MKISLNLESSQIQKKFESQEHCYLATFKKKLNMLCVFGYSTKLPRGRLLNKIRSLFSRIFLLFLDFINFYGFIDFHRSSWILWIFRDFLDFPDFLDFHGFFFIFEDFLILKSGNLSALPLVNYLRLRFYFCINRAIGKYAVVRKN